MPCLHAVIRRLGRAARRFARARRANVAITFALTLIPMLALTGAAIDFSRANALKTALQQAAAQLPAAFEDSQLPVHTVHPWGSNYANYPKLAKSAFAHAC